MKTVWKYPIKLEDSQALMLPAGAEILSAGCIDGNLFLWALVESSHADDLVPFRVDIRGTGHPANYSKRAFVSTVIAPPFVWHVFAWPENFERCFYFAKSESAHDTGGHKFVSEEEGLRKL